MSLHYRQRRINECIKRYTPVTLAGGSFGVLDNDLGGVVGGAIYEDPEMARAKCRELAAEDLEEFLASLLLPILTLLHQGQSDGAAKALTKIVQREPLGKP